MLKNNQTIFKDAVDEETVKYNFILTVVCSKEFEATIMKAVICLVFFAISAIASAKPTEDHYITKYDNIDIDSIIKNDRLLRKYVDCLLGTENCNKDGDELKSKWIPL